MSELLAVEFTGEGGPRSADMGTVIRSWRAAGGRPNAGLALETARSVAARLGAGRFLSASVVGVGRRLTLNAQVRRTSDGNVESSAGPVQGIEDSLPAMVQRVASQLIAMPAGRHAMVETAPEAMRAWRDGLAAFRRAEWSAAAERFLRALEVDSTFAPAALGYLKSSGWSPIPGDLQRVRRLAWTHRDRLDPVGVILLPTYLGPRYPEPATIAEVIEALEAASRVAPDNAEIWFKLGDELLHNGTLAVPDAAPRARMALERAQMLDSGLSEIPIHLSSLALTLEDPATTRFQAVQIRRWAPAHPWRALQRYEEAIASGDARRVGDSLAAGIRSLATDESDVLGIFAYVQLYPSHPVDTILLRSVIAERGRRATSTADRLSTARQLATLLRNLGRMAAADSALLANPVGEQARVRIVTPLVSGQRVAAATDATRQLRSAVESAPDAPASQRDACVLGVWRAMSRDSGRAAELAPILQPTGKLETAGWCGPLVSAVAAITRGAPGAPALVARADSIVGLGQPTHQGWEGMVLARLWLQLGDSTSALRAVRRDYVIQQRGLSYLSDYRRMEGVLAAATGDVTGARRAYRHYLNLRLNPEPSLMAQRDSVRAELARLEHR